MRANIRLAENLDADAITNIYRPIVESTIIAFEVEAPGRAVMARRIHDTLRIDPWLVCEIDGRTAGYAYASGHRVKSAYQWSVDTSVYIDEGHRRRGVGRGLYDSLLAILAAQGYVNAYAENH